MEDVLTLVVFLIIGVAIFGLPVYWIWEAIKEREKRKNLLKEAQRKATELKSGGTYLLTGNPFRTEIRLASIGLRARTIEGTLIVTLPRWAEIKNLYPLRGWSRFSIVYLLNGKWFAPTLDVELLKLDNFWSVYPESVEVEVSS